MSFRSGLAVILLFAMTAGAARAQDAPAPPLPDAPQGAETPFEPAPERGRNTLSVMAGLYTTSFWARSFSYNNVGYEPNFVIAVITGRDLLTTPWGLRVGQESGMALRFGAGFSIETWTGVTVSFGARLIGGVMLSPQMVLGLSNITNAIGVERGREAAVPDGDISRLIYLGTHLAVLRESLPFIEGFYRLHHRSGALGVFGNVPDGHNAPSIGFTIRY